MGQKGDKTFQAYRYSRTGSHMQRARPQGY